MYRRVRRGRGRWVAKVSFGLSTHRVPPMRSVWKLRAKHSRVIEYIFNILLYLRYSIYTQVSRSNT